MPYREPPTAPRVVLHYAPKGTGRRLPRVVWRALLVGSLLAAWAWSATFWSLECHRRRGEVTCEVDTYRLLPSGRSHQSLADISAIVTRDGDHLTYAKGGPAGDAAEAAAAALARVGVDATASAILLPTAAVGSADAAARIEKFVESSEASLSTHGGLPRAAICGLVVLVLVGLELARPLLGRMTIAVDAAQNLLTVSELGGRVTRFELDGIAAAEVEHQSQGVHRVVLALTDGRRVALSMTFHRGGQHHALVDALRPHLRGA